MASRIPLSNLDGHLERIIEDIPVTFRWNGTDYQAVRSSPELHQVMEIGGIDEPVEYNLFVRASDLPALHPKIGDIFIMDNFQMKVLRIKASPDAAQLLTYSLGFARRGPIPTIP